MGGEAGGLRRRSLWQRDEDREGEVRGSERERPEPPAAEGESGRHVFCPTAAAAAPIYLSEGAEHPA